LSRRFCASHPFEVYAEPARARKQKPAMDHANGLFAGGEDATRRLILAAGLDGAARNG
jgi:hypothetical protein